MIGRSNGQFIQGMETGAIHGRRSSVLQLALAEAEVGDPFKLLDEPWGQDFHPSFPPSVVNLEMATRNGLLPTEGKDSMTIEESANGGDV